ncbi:Hypothetical predicted protein [Paramuricea clavata]|uniref:Uncharacterized protein n=1 Tax=Paramuricea clavata TaxID=317549 RepID=A0A7D9HYZ9_PARCT|nr:Hypothetical predicted protein [Paramuricea clavata]
MLHSNKLLQSLLAVTLLLHVAICIAAVPYLYRTLSYSVLGKPTHSYKVPASIPTKHKWLKSRIQYYSNTTASYNLTTTAILACGDVHPNPGPALSSSRKQVGAKLNSLRALYLNARSLKATAESTDDKAKKTSQQSEHLMIELYPANCSKFLLSLFYRPPNSEEDILIELRDSLDRLDESCQFVLVGDFNLPNIDWSLDFPSPTSKGSFKEELFCEIITDQFRYQKDVGPTHLHGNKLDCVFSNSPKLITNVNCTNPTDLFPTDHYLIEFDIKVCFQKAKSIRRTVYDFNNANFDGAREHLMNVPLDSAISNNSDIDECWKAWKDLFITAIDKSYHKHILRNRNSPPANTYNNSTATTSHKKAELFNTFFASVFLPKSSSQDANLNMTPKTYEIISDIQISQNEVEQYLNHLDTTKAYGPDGIPPRLMKELSREISTSLCSLFNMSLTTCRLPMEWKHANVIPIHKKDCVEPVTNYRPISLLPIISKVLERCVFNNIYPFVRVLINNVQHGFLRNRSCITQLLGILHDIGKNLDRNKQIDVLYLDFSKAFDSVDHDILLHKLQMHGINGTLLRWFENYLNDRWQ